MKKIRILIINNEVMIEDEIISFETAILAKEKRCYIDGCCRVFHKCYLVPKGEEPIKYTSLVPNSGLWNWKEYPEESYIIAYTQTTLARYLREKHYLSVEVFYNVVVDKFIDAVINIKHGDGRPYVVWDRSYYGTYEEAMDASLQIALNMI